MCGRGAGPDRGEGGNAPNEARCELIIVQPQYANGERNMLAFSIFQRL